MKYILRNNYGTKHIDALKTKRYPFTASDLRFAKKIFRGPAAITGHNLVNPPSHFANAGDQLITMLRDPVVRCAAHYQYNVLRRGMTDSFQTWISNEANQDLSVRTIAGTADVTMAKWLLKEHYSFVGFTEYFTDALKLLKIQLQLPLDLGYRHLISARDNQIKEQLLSDEASLRLLRKYNSLDMELYDYALNELFLPALEQHREALQTMPDPVQKIISRNEPAVRKSIRFNKFVYRQLIKLFRQ